MRALRFATFLATAYTLVSVLATSRGQEGAGTTTLRVLVPKGQEVTVLLDGKEVTGKGTTRTITAPPLAKDKELIEVTAKWSTNNYTDFFRTKKVPPMPGKVVTIDLRQPDAKNPDRIEIRYVPTPDDVVARMCKLAKVGKGDVVFDLGCGDGRIVISAIADFGAKRGVGADLDPERIADSKAGAKERGVSDRVEFRVEDVLKLKDLSAASVVMLYMGDDVNLRLRPILQKTLAPGSRVVSHRFGMGDWAPDRSETFTAEDGDEYTLLLWYIR